MKTAIKYVAMDVHQASIVSTIRDESGKITMRATLETKAGPILEFLEGLRGRVWLVFEEGTQSQWLHDLVVCRVEKVVVCDPRQIHEKGNKGDRPDADRLSELLRLGGLRSVYKGSPGVRCLKELVRNYTALVQDSTRVMLRIKALFRARAIPTRGQSVYGQARRNEWLAQLDRGAAIRAGCLYAELDVLLALRPQAKKAMIAEARRQPGWKILRRIPFLGAVRVAQILAVIGTPYRFRGKRQLWPYVGLAVVTRTSAEHEFRDGQLRRRSRPPLTRGLNRNHNHVLKGVFKAAANAAASAPGPLKDFYDAMVARGVRPEMAKLTLARKIVALTLRLWKKGELYDPAKLTMQST